jgi:predicted O-methyltransferase YrrM
LTKINEIVEFNNIPHNQWLDPVYFSVETLFNLAVKPETIKYIQRTLGKLTSDQYLEFMQNYYKLGIAKFGDSWGYCDLLTILQASALALQPRTYLEIGVRCGRSLAVVAAACPQVDIFGCDLWLQNYAGMNNPGVEFVQAEMQKVGYTGNLGLLTGDSRQVLPQLFVEHPELYFDLITVDGDHAYDGARADLQNVIPRLKLGGVIVMDDICHPQHLYLADVWDEFFAKNEKFQTKKYTALGYGVAYAIRKSF